MIQIPENNMKCLWLFISKMFHILLKFRLMNHSYDTSKTRNRQCLCTLHVTIKSIAYTGPIFLLICCLTMGLDRQDTEDHHLLKSYSETYAAFFAVPLSYKLIFPLFPPSWKVFFRHSDHPFCEILPFAAPPPGNPFQEYLSEWPISASFYVFLDVCVQVHGGREIQPLAKTPHRYLILNL